MPVTKPTVIPEFATGPDAIITEPSTERKADGWEPNEVPPPGYFNWLSKHTTLWFLWLQDITNQPFLWDAIQTFYKGILVEQHTTNAHGIQSTGNGSGVGVYGLGGNSDAAGVAGSGAAGHNGDGGSFISTGTGKGVRCASSSSSSGGEALRCTGGLLSTGCHTIASVDGYSLLVEQVTTGGLHYDRPAARIVADSVCTGLEVEGGADAGIAATFKSGVDANGAVQISTQGSDCIYGLFVSCSGTQGSAIQVGLGHLQCTAATPADTADIGRNNVLHADLIPKAWGIIKISGPTASSYPNTTHLTYKGVNVATVVFENNSRIAVTMARGMADSDYAVTLGKSLSSAGGPSANVYDIDVLITSATVFKIQTGNGSNGSFDTAGFNGQISFHVFGRQAVD